MEYCTKAICPVGSCLAMSTVGYVGYGYVDFIDEDIVTAQLNSTRVGVTT